VKKRIIFTFGVAILLIVTLLVRFLQIQIINGSELSVKADKQYLLTDKLDIVRGDIYDRNMISFTNRSERDYILTRPPCIIHGTNRYDGDSIAKLVTGYVKGKDSIGDMGLERQYNDILSDNDSISVSAVKNGTGAILDGLGYAISAQNAPDNIQTTLDYHIQDICEKVLTTRKATGAIVVEDVESGDILAMGSKPDYDHLDLEKSFNSDDGEFINRAGSAYNLGSVFKTVVVAAALEAGIDLSHAYYCNGYVNVNGHEIKCSSYKTGGHGLVGLEDAYAESCNSYFIELGLELGYDKIVSMAQRFGFGNVTGLNAQGIYETPGSLIMNSNDSSDTAYLSIGQGTLLATPLQIASMMATIANGGVKVKTNIVSAITDKEGNSVQDLEEHKVERVVSENTAKELLHLMSLVVSEGTGNLAGTNLKYPAAGKTGSAETGIFNNGVQTVHHWFGGLYPVIDGQKPKYSITVFVENGATLGIYAPVLFADVAKQLESYF
jgi:peptidoglycan glycosyltransferase/penicillin-binding protein 2